MNNINDKVKTIEEIKRVLDTFIKISNERLFNIKHEKAHLWEYKIKSFRVLFILPKNIEFKVQDIKISLEEYNIYYLIDIFDNIDHKNSISYFKFYTLLFYLKDYRNKFSEVLQVDDISKYFIERFLKIDNDLEKFNEEYGASQEMLSWWANDNHSKSNPVLILGDRGIGKSWCVMKFCINQYEKHLTNPWLFPVAIYINLRTISKSIIGQYSVLDTIKYQLTKIYSLRTFPDTSVWEAFLRSEKLIIVLDGFDEMSKEMTDEILIKNIWEIFSLTRLTSKIILTSRITLFKSHTHIYEHFAFTRLIQDIPEKSIYIQKEREGRKDFNIWELNSLNEKEIQLFNDNYKSGFLKKGGIKLQKIGKLYNSVGTIQYEILQLSKIPALHKIISHLLGSNKFNLLKIIELSLSKAIIEFNILEDRSLDEFYTIEGEKLVLNSFNSSQKLNVLQQIAWYLFERHEPDFNLEELTSFINEILAIDYSVVLNDLKTQTVIRLNSDDRFEFVSEGIFAFLIFKYFSFIFENKSNNDIKYGIKEFGRFDFNGSSLGKRVLIYMITFFQLDIELKERVINLVNEVIKESQPFSPWLKFLKSNCASLGISTNQLKRLSYWSNQLINKSIDILEDINCELVLISNTKYLKEKGQKDIKPFYISSTEITNKQFGAFLKDITFRNNSELPELNGLNWMPIMNEDMSNPLSNIINKYHIIYWRNGEMPLNKINHPVVWVSWYSCASFCNWLSIKAGLDEYYHFVYERDENNIIKKLEKVIITGSEGFRLPNNTEWEIAARAGNIYAEFVWDFYKNDNGSLNDLGTRIKERLETFSEDSYPIKNERPNEYGIYGLMGNVREWVDITDKSELKDIYDTQLLKGSAWLINNDGLQIKYSNPLIAQNNNIDVGFRIARSLKEDELKLVNHINNK